MSTAASMTRTDVLGFALPAHTVPANEAGFASALKPSGHDWQHGIQAERQYQPNVRPVGVRSS